MPPRPGPFECAQLSLALARLPGRFERDEDEAYRILNHIIASYKRGVFADDEVVVLFVEPGEPPQLRPVKSLPEDARREIEDGASLWRDGAVMLTSSATKRYLEASTLAGAPRVLVDWFTDDASPRSPGYAAAGDGKQLLVRDTAGTGQPNGQAVGAGRAAGQPEGQDTPPTGWPRRTGGRPPEKRLRVEAAMKAQIKTGELTRLALRNLKQVSMEQEYGVNRETANKARKNVLSEFPIADN